MNSTAPAMPGLVRLGGHHVDHFFTDGRAGEVEILDAAPLSDHLPLRLRLSAARSPNPRSMSSAFSPSVPARGSTPSATATP